MDTYSVDLTSPEFAQRFGSHLRQVRRSRGLRVRHLADDDIVSSVLRDVEKGRHQLDAMLVATLAGRYEADLDGLLPAREAVVILATGTIAAGGLDESFVPGELDSLLEAYLRLVRRLRGETATGAVALRREDVIDIADQFARPRPDVVDRIGVLVGATGPQRRAMVDLYLAGASVVGVTV